MSTEIAFKEVYDVLRLLGKEYINKIPANIYNYICENKDNDYITNIYEGSEFEKDISKEALEIITYINLSYWCDEKQKKELMKRYNEEALKKQKKLYDIFPNSTEKEMDSSISGSKTENYSEKTAEKDKEMIPSNKNGLINRIFVFLKNLFKNNKNDK